MTDPCINNDCVDAGLVRRFDLFKWLIMALLLGRR